MKTIVLVALIFLSSHPSYGQAPSEGSSRLHKDSIVAALANRLQVSQQQAATVLATIDSSFTKVRGMASNRALTSEQKTTAIKEIAAARDTTIASLLTPVQVDKLKAFMAENKLRKTSD